MASLVSDEILSAPVSHAEADKVASRFLSSIAPREVATVGSLAEELGMKPLLVARAVSELRGDSDQELVTAIKQNDFLIKKLGTARLSAEVVSGDRRLMDKFWRNNDPLGVYRAGDMWYVDENHKWMPYFPILILVPTALLVLVPLAGWVMSLLGMSGRP
ncbi:MAG: hypothetical protein QE269_02365 [Fimbriimonas sp.]|nr:hypothetical protein [Fimbriimonas sp.]